MTLEAKVIASRIASGVKSYATWPLWYVPEVFVARGDSVGKALVVAIGGCGYIGLFEGVAWDIALHAASLATHTQTSSGVEYGAVLAGLPALRAVQGLYAVMKARKQLELR